MTDPSESSSADSNAASDSVKGANVQAAVQKAVETGDQIRERVHGLIVDLMRGQQGTATVLRKGLSDILGAAVDVAKKLPPEKADSALKGVVDGVASGVQSVVQAAGYAAQEASARGQRFASEDVTRTVNDLNAIGQIILESVAYASERLGTEVSTGARELKSHSERAVESLRPVIKETVTAITQHPVQTATEVAETAVRGGRLIAGSLLSAVSGILSGAAEAIDPSRNRKS